MSAGSKVQTISQTKARHLYLPKELQHDIIALHKIQVNTFDRLERAFAEYFLRACVLESKRKADDSVP